MDYELRIVVEKVAVGSQKVVSRDTLKVYDVKTPQSILDLGLRHQQQISLLEKVQNSLLAAQSNLIDPSYDACPKCGQKLKKKGFTQSKFHAVFSDHKIGIQKHQCCNPECDWQSAPTTTSVFGTSIHPDLAKLQCEQGALHSYRQAQTNLQKLNVHRRAVNNHTKIKRLTNQVGTVIAEANFEPIAITKETCGAKGLILQVDGGHIPTKEKDKRSFEAMSAIVYRPENIRSLDQHHREIENKSCALSARDDELVTMKAYTLNAARKQGMTKQTEVTALADGGLSCWSAILSLRPHCNELLCILDWFHIAMRFQHVRGAVDEGFQETLESIKWKLWHGKSQEALSKLKLLLINVADIKKRSKLQKLYDYLERNQAYLVNYEERENQGLTYTTQVCESHIESLINDRHKRSKKMQWTRDGAHNVLQINGMIASKEWSDRWQKLILAALAAAA